MDALETVATQREHARAALQTAQLPAADIDALMGAGRDVIALRTRNARAPDKKPGATRLGGVPDLPTGVGWPSRDGYEYDFVGQLRMEDLATLDVHSLLPHDGVLSFFAGHDITPSSEWQLSFRVDHYRGLPLAPVEDLTPRPRHRRVPKPRGIDFEPVFFLPPPWSAWLPSLTRNTEYEDVYDSLYRFTTEPVFPASGLLGFDRPNEAVLESSERMLLRLEHGESIPYPFEEMVNLCFVIGADALAQRDFGAVRAFEGASI
jgi:hypothetical protein